MPIENSTIRKSNVTPIHFVNQEIYNRILGLRERQNQPPETTNQTLPDAVNPDQVLPPAPVIRGEVAQIATAWSRIFGPDYGPPLSRVFKWENFSKVCWIGFRDSGIKDVVEGIKDLVNIRQKISENRKKITENLELWKEAGEQYSEKVKLVSVLQNRVARVVDGVEEGDLGGLREELIKACSEEARLQDKCLQEFPTRMRNLMKKSQILEKKLLGFSICYPTRGLRDNIRNFQNTLLDIRAIEVAYGNNNNQNVGNRNFNYNNFSLEFD